MAKIKIDKPLYERVVHTAERAGYSSADEIARAVNNITSTTEQSVASTRLVGRAARDLNRLAGSLAESVDK